MNKSSYTNKCLTDLPQHRFVYIIKFSLRICRLRNLSSSYPQEVLCNRNH